MGDDRLLQSAGSEGTAAPSGFRDAKRGKADDANDGKRASRKLGLSNSSLLCLIMVLDLMTLSLQVSGWFNVDTDFSCKNRRQ